jgi:octaprenyl-diphosphate synthase
MATTLAPSPDLLPRLAVTPPRSKPSAFATIAGDLDEVDRTFDDALAKHRQTVLPLIQHLRNYRGKRFRPALLLLAAKACGSILTKHYTLAAAVEMIHTATLIHDDVLDDAETRRHLPTYNAQWGNKKSILFGDMLFTQAFHLTSTVDRQACELIGEATNTVCAGELRQVCETGNLTLTEDAYFEMVEGKTAALTEVSTRLGAIYAGARPEIVEHLAEYGRCVGIAFQIADDLLDLVGEDATAGKTLGTDLDQGKLTLPLIRALAKLAPAEASEFRGWLAEPHEEHRRRILEALHRTGALASAKRTAEDFARRGRENLECLPRSESRTILEHLTEWSIRREK